MNKQTEINYENLAYWPLDRLTDFIVSGQREAIKTKAGKVNALLMQACKDNITSSQDVYRVLNGFLNVLAQLHEFLEMESELIFPYIRQMNEQHAKGEMVLIPAFGSLGRAVSLQEKEWRRIAGLLEKTGNDLRVLNLQRENELESMFRQFAEACASLQLIRQEILFPRAVEMENKIERVSAQGLEPN